MNDNITVSIIIPTFNRREYVQEAIESVFAQSYTNYELIVIDDGSTDGTDRVIESKYMGKLKYIWQNNQGEAKARNHGISLSTGKYLAFLDSDDKWHPEKLLYQVNMIEGRRNKDSNIALICSSVWLIDENGRLISSRLSGRKKNIEKLQLEDYLYKPQIFGPSSNAVFYNEFVKEVGGFDEDIQFGEDWGLLIKLREKYKFIYLDKPLTYIRVHKVNQQSFPNHELIENKLSDSIKIVDRFPKAKVDVAHINYAKAQFYEKTAYWYFIYHDWENGIKNLILAGELDAGSIGNKNKVIQRIASAGYESALYNIEKKVPDLLRYFEQFYYVNLAKIWPNGLLSDPGVKKKTVAVFSQIMVHDNNIIKTRKEKIQLCRQAFSYNRYLRSLSIWIIFLSNILGLTGK